MITFIHLGDDIHREINLGTTLKVPRAAPTHVDLYACMIAAAKSVTTEYFSIVDGGPDTLLDTFESATEDLCKKMSKINSNLGSTRESINGRSAGFMHHGVVVRTSAFNKLKIPESGIFSFEELIYGMLKRTGPVLHDVIAYNWVPSPGGAASWPTALVAVRNSRRWIDGKPPTNI